MFRCPVCGQHKCICPGTAPWSGTPLDIPTIDEPFVPNVQERTRNMVKTSKLVKVRTGPTSYLKMTEKDAKAYRKDVGEYGVEPEADEPEAVEEKAADKPAENKARKAPAQKKADG